MIGWFPHAYPDELLYSICARYGARVQYPLDISLVKELFGSLNVTAIIDLPGYLNHLVASLPASYGCTVETFIDNHTLLRYYGPFLPPERLRQLRTEMATTNRTATYRSLGLLASHIPIPEWLRFCPLCVQEDRWDFGESYWHRVHQVAGVEICAKHGVLLQNSTIPTRNKRTRCEFVTTENALRVTVLLPHTLPYLLQDSLLKIAQDAAWLLRQSNLIIEPSHFHRQYLFLLAEHGLATYSGQVHMRSLLKAFETFYPPDLLSLLHCEIDERVKENWLCRLVRRPEGILHPLYHLLLMHFLGYRAEDFFQLPVDHPPFGTGPWPCLNSASSHYHELKIQQCDIVYSRDMHCRPIGKFVCTCGYIYRGCINKTQRLQTITPLVLISSLASCGGT
jgi:hypothetical protein